MEIDYAMSGVNVDLGNDASKMLYEAAKKSFEFRKGTIGEVIIPFDDFSGLRFTRVGGLPRESVSGQCSDGVGTKVVIAQRMDKHDTIAFDLLAMVCDDAVVQGGEPVLVTTVIDVNSLKKEDGTFNTEAMRQLATGYYNAARAANVAIINGELAELGECVGGYGGFNYNWSANATFFAKEGKLFTRKEINAGDYLVAFQEKGFRSNGMSLVRNVFEQKLGDDWHRKEYRKKILGDLVLEPSKIYCRAIVHMHGGFATEGCCDIHGVVHITGGGVPEKLGRILKPSGFGAKLSDLFTPCDAMLYCQQLGETPDRKAYQTWNMGQGMFVITPEPEKVITEAERFGIHAKTAGRITEEKGIRIMSRGFFSSGEDMLF